MSLPACSRCVANEWRSVCGVAGLGDAGARRAARLNARCKRLRTGGAGARRRVRGSIDSAGRRKHPEPAPRRAGARVLALQRIGQLHAAAAGRERRPATATRPARSCACSARHQRRGQHGDAVLAALAVAHDDVAALEVDVLHAQAQRLRSGACRCRRAGAPARPCVAVEQARAGAHLGHVSAPPAARGSRCGRSSALHPWQAAGRAPSGRGRAAPLNACSVRGRRDLPLGGQHGKEGLRPRPRPSPRMTHARTSARRREPSTRTPPRCAGCSADIGAVRALGRASAVAAQARGPAAA